MSFARILTIKPWRTPMQGDTLPRDSVPSDAAWIALMLACCVAGAALILFAQVLHG